MIGLTPTQARAKRLIGDLIVEQGQCPTYEEIAIRLGLASKGTAFNMVDELVARGHAQRTAASKRNIVLLHEPVSRAPDGAPLFFVPLKGAV